MILSGAKDRHNFTVLFLSSLMVISLGSCHFGSNEPYKNWEMYGGGNEKIQYSALTQIDTSNVKNLAVAWTYHTNDAEPGSQIEVNPVISDGVLFGVSPRLKLFASNPSTGKIKWIFDPFAEGPVINKKKRGINICRGVAVYKDEKAGQLIFYTAGASLYCVSGQSGKLVTDFGNNGSIDLHRDLDRNTEDIYITSTSPGIIYKDLIIIGTAVAEDATAAPGHIRAYDVHTGKLRWIFHTIPFPGEDGYDSWDDKEAYKHTGGTNAWAGFCLDEKKGIVFAPTGSSTDDWYGGKRLGNNLFANCVLAIDAATGKRIWHFQTVHHDVWDRDLPAAPVLVTVTKDGQKIEAVVQVTKSGFIFLLDRLTGKPVYPVEERAVPVISDLTGERLSPTQPFPTFFEPYVRQLLNENDLNRNLPDSSYQDIRQKLAGYTTGNLFNPPSKHPVLIFPGMQGGAEWGGPAYDPATGLLYINANEIPRVLTMIDAKEDSVTGNQTNGEAGKIIFSNTCAACHGTDRKGGGDFPSLIDISRRYDESSFKNLVTTGRRRMPAFSQLTESEKTALSAYVLNSKQLSAQQFVKENKIKDPYHKIPYVSATNRPSKFESKEGYPAVAPPWGTLTAINLNTGKTVWKTPLGDYPELKAKGLHTGTENFGGPVVTAGGLLFIAATKDEKFRAFNKRTGELLWETDLPAAGFATPAIYEIDGKQYVVIACGGGKLKAKSGDAYVAYALPGK